MADALPVLSAGIAPSAHVRLQIAPVASSRRSRRGGGRVRSAALLLLEFRSAAVGAASLIVGAVLGGTMRLGARVQRVFAVLLKGSVSGVFHVPNVEHGAPACPTTDLSNSTTDVARMS